MFSSIVCFWLMAMCCEAAASHASLPLRSLPDQLADQAAHDVALAEAVLDQAELRFQALARLNATGDSSFLETGRAQLILERRRAEYSAAKQLAEFTSTLKATHNQVSTILSQPDPVLLLTLPEVDSGLVPGTASTLVLPISDAEQKELLPLISRSVVSDPNPRLIAWTERIRRLESLDDASPAAVQERLFAETQVRIAQAEQNCWPAQQLHITMVTQLTPFRMGDAQIDDDQSLLTLVQARRTQIQLNSQLQTVESEIRFLEQLEHRVAEAANHAATSREELRDVQTDLFRKRTERQTLLRRIAMHSESAGGNKQLTQALLLELMHHQRENLQSQIQYRIELRILAEKLENVSKDDSWFQGEHQHVRLLLDLAAANENLKGAVCERQQIQQQILASMADSSSGYSLHIGLMPSSKEYLPAWQNLLRELAESRLEGDALAAELQREEFVLAGLQKLSASGHASWKEITAAEVRCQELRRDLKQLPVQHDLVAQVANILAIRVRDSESISQKELAAK